MINKFYDFLYLSFLQLYQLISSSYFLFFYQLLSMCSLFYSETLLCNPEYSLRSIPPLSDRPNFKSVLHIDLILVSKFSLINFLHFFSVKLFSFILGFNIYFFNDKSFLMMTLVPGSILNIF